MPTKQNNSSLYVLLSCSFTGTKDEKVHVQGHVNLKYKVRLEGYRVVLCLFEVLDPKKMQKNHRSSFSRFQYFDVQKVSIRRHLASYDVIIHQSSLWVLSDDIYVGKVTKGFFYFSHDNDEKCASGGKQLPLYTLRVFKKI